MLVRGGARNDPRVLKEARTLAEAGYAVIIVAMKLPEESRSTERLGQRIVVVRTATGFLQKLRGLFGSGEKGRSGASPGTAPARDASARAPSRSRLALMVVSRGLLLLKMVALTLRTRPDVVHAHDFSTLATGCVAAGLARVPLVYDAHEVNVDREGYYRQLRWLISRVEGCLLKRCDRVITTTEMRARHFRRYYHLKERPTVLQNRPPYRPATRSDQLRERFGVPADALLCIYQGGLQQGRGLHNLVRAIACTEGIHCVLLGGGHQAGALHQLAQELGVGGRVHQHPLVPLNDVAALTASADVGVQVIRNTCFNHWSTDSNKLFEYALAGIPVVASDFPEIRRVVRKHGFGILVNSDSVGDIASALERLRDDAELRCQLRARAAASARALSWDSQAPTLLSLYESLDRERRVA